MKRLSRQAEMLIRIDERVSALPDMKDKLDRVVGHVKAHGEALRWLTWGFRAITAGVGGALLYVIFKVG